MTRSTALKTAIASLAIASAPLAGCSSAGEGAVSGAGIGALTGLVLGSFGGNAGEGAVIGTAVGAVAGGVIGDQNERNARNARQNTTVIYRDSEPRDTGWDNRYEQRYEPRSSTTYYETHHYYESRPQPRVVIRYDTHRPRYRSWHYRDRYCR